MSEAPFYLQLRDQLVMLIKTGELPASSRLPAERELAERFSTTRVTLRQALTQLESEGQIYRSNRRGWFVSPARLNYEPVKDVSFTRYVTKKRKGVKEKGSGTFTQAKKRGQVHLPKG